MTIKLKFFNYLFVLVCLIMGTGMSVHAEEQTFTRINSIEELNDGDRFIVVNDQHQAWRIISSLVSAGISSEGDCLQPMRLNDNKQANSKLNFFISSNIK